MKTTNKKKKIVFVSGDDWVGIYVNGKLVVQDHSLNPIEVLNAIEADFEYVYPDQEWLETEGQFPDDLKNVKLEIPF